ncbi:hypothetical protein C0J52_06450 [Blattella germanica]|nr:hypothetical protein C0J52_06450 [Blattella germanica]
MSTNSSPSFAIRKSIIHKCMLLQTVLRDTKLAYKMTWKDYILSLVAGQVSIVLLTYFEWAAGAAFPQSLGLGLPVLSFIVNSVYSILNVPKMLRILCRLDYVYGNIGLHFFVSPACNPI